MTAMRRSTPGSERGQAGFEALPFGVLVLVGGMLLALNLWTVVDARAAVDAAARDYLRAYTSAPSAAAGRDAGTVAATSTLTGHGRSTAALSIDPPTERFGPCRAASVRVSVVIPAIHLPFADGIGDTTVSSTQSELVQPYSTMDAATPGSLEGTLCDG